MLAGFTAGQSYADDADYSAVSWLIHRTGITKGAAVGHTAWAKRVAAHPRVLAALASGLVTEPAGRLICLWTGKSRWPTCSGWRAAPPCRSSGPLRCGSGGPRAGRRRPRPTARTAPGWTATPPRRSRTTRRWQLGARLGGPSLPLDIGQAQTIPPGIRNAVILRDRKCRWAGGCNQPAAACEVRHVTHIADGGKTCTTGCVLLCTHHQVAIHRWGWTLILNPDGTTTAWNKDKTKILHSHGPPARAG
jgi:hypothetical protein